MQGEENIETLYYVPMSIKMILDIKGEVCIVNNSEIKTVDHIHINIDYNIGKTGGENN